MLRMHDRKTTWQLLHAGGALVESILDWTLDPAINEALSGDEPESALLDLKILDPACGSGHFLTAAAKRVGFALATVRCCAIQPQQPKRSSERVVMSCSTAFMGSTSTL